MYLVVLPPLCLQYKPPSTVKKANSPAVSTIPSASSRLPQRSGLGQPTGETNEAVFICLSALEPSLSHHAVFYCSHHFSHLVSHALGIPSSKTSSAGSMRSNPSGLTSPPSGSVHTNTAFPIRDKTSLVIIKCHLFCFLFILLTNVLI